MNTWRAVIVLLLTLHAAAIVSRPGAGVSAAAAGPDGPAAPARLVDTGLYANGQLGVVADANRPFAPQYPLWTDGAAKSRWIYLPPDSAIDATNAADWEFPVGTRFWKEFRFDGRPVETRFLWRASADRWVFASYAWNADATDALLAPAAGIANVAAVSETKRHSIPAVSDCRACHGDRRIEPLGFNALQLSSDRDPEALHGEPLTDRMWTVRSLVAEGRLRTADNTPVAGDIRISGNPATRAVLGYLSTNCGSCHRAGADIVLLGTSLKHSDVLDGKRTLARMLDHRTRWQVPGAADGESRLLDRHHPDTSALLTRMRSRRPSSQMPPIGTVLPDQAAIEAIGGWIASSSVHPGFITSDGHATP
jgi:cytochrome c553